MRTTEKQRRAYITDYYASGLSKVDFCKHNSLNSKTFYRWIKQYSPDYAKHIKNNKSPSLKSDCTYIKQPSFVSLKVRDLPDMHSVELSKVNSAKVTYITFKTDNFSLEFPLSLDKNIPEFNLVLQALHDLSF